MNTAKVTGVVMAALITPFSGAKADIPLSGVYSCQVDFMHMMQGTAGMAMISAANCTLDGDDKNTVTFTNNVLFDDKGTGKLINSNGLTELEGKPATAFVGIESVWQLEMKDGQMTGYAANGVNDIVAGEYAGKKIYWSGTPTGPDTMKISYEVKD